MIFELFKLYLLCWSTCYAATEKISHNHHKRLEIARADMNNGFITGKAHRRQEVIHPLDEDSNSKSSDDDIEKYGKTIDATGAVEKSSIATKKDGAMKEVIAKIKEIQDKIFKRTGNKGLEAKLKEMMPQETSEPFRPMKTIQESGDRRKIIPEDVVDKILKKFQQLRSEAKNMAFQGTSRTQKNSESAPEVSDHAESPYASIGPPKEALEIKNRTQHADDIAALKSDGTPEAVINTQNNANNNIQIPIGNSPADSSQLNSDKPTPPGIPLMFVKHGENLIPVFNEQNGGQPAVSVTEKGSVQYSTNPGVAPPAAMNNVASFMAGNLDAGRNIQTPPVIDASQLTSVQMSGFSRCSIPGPDCQQQEQQEQQAIPNTDNSQTTVDLLNKLLHSPVFPQLASRLLEEGSTTNPLNLPGDSRELNPMTGSNTSPNIIPMPSNSNEMQGTSPASVQFGLKENIASELPGTPSMLKNPVNLEQPDTNEEVQHFLDSMPENNPSVPAQPYPDTPITHSFREHSVNDISDPMDNEMKPFKEKSPDELLEYAKYRSLVSPDSNGPSNYFPANSNYFGGIQRNGINTENEPPMDPSNLLDTLHSSQLKSNLAGAGDPTSINDLDNYHDNIRDEQQEEEMGNEKHDIPEPAPDDLLDKLRHWDQNLRKMPVRGNSRHRIPLKFGSMDPSFADEIRTPGGGIQAFDVERKDIATEHNSNKALLRNQQQIHRHGDISVLSDDMLQYKNGRLSMDSNDVVGSFQKENRYSRNRIRRPRHYWRHPLKTITRTFDPSARWNIERPHTVASSEPTNDVELRVNGELLTDNTSLRSTIVNGKVHPGKGRTFASKDPVQIELSHGDDKRKIINILTKGRYNITQDVKRTKIPKTKLQI